MFKCPKFNRQSWVKLLQLFFSVYSNLCKDCNFLKINSVVIFYKKVQFFAIFQVLRCFWKKKKKKKKKKRVNFQLSFLLGTFKLEINRHLEMFIFSQCRNLGMIFIGPLLVQFVEKFSNIFLSCKDVFATIIL